MGGAIRVVTMVYGVAGYFNHRSIGKVRFCYKQYINVGIVKKDWIISDVCLCRPLAFHTVVRRVIMASVECISDDGLDHV